MTTRPRRSRLSSPTPDHLPPELALDHRLEDLRPLDADELLAAEPARGWRLAWTAVRDWLDGQAPDRVSAAPRADLVTAVRILSAHLAEVLATEAARNAAHELADELEAVSDNPGLRTGHKAAHDAIRALCARAGADPEVTIARIENAAAADESANDADAPRYEHEMDDLIDAAIRRRTGYARKVAAYWAHLRRTHRPTGPREDRILSWDEVPDLSGDRAGDRARRWAGQYRDLDGAPLLATIAPSPFVPVTDDELEAWDGRDPAEAWDELDSLDLDRFPTPDADQ